VKLLGIAQQQCCKFGGVIADKRKARNLLKEKRIEKKTGGMLYIYIIN
jgi:hypothetical protein